MDKFSNWIVKHHILILIITIMLMIPSVFGMINTRINYDMLDYLPDDIDTVKGQNVLLNDFDKGAFSLIVVEDMEPKEILKLKAKIEEVENVETVIWYDNIMDISLPMEFLLDKYYDAFNNGNATLMGIFFNTSSSSDETIEAVAKIRNIADKQCFIAGMSALVADLKEASDREEPVYVGLAVLFATITMMLFLDSYILPFIFLLSIGMAIMLNLGTNIFKGEISYITKALSAVLQLGVTMDYSIFLWHSYSEEKITQDGDKYTAMSHAIRNTITSVIGSSITTVAGFIALCFMTFTLGMDLGIVMAKGVVFGVIGCVTTLPALILIFDNIIEKTKHRPLLPKMDGLAKFITKYNWIFLIVFLIILVPAFIGYRNTELYYDFGNVLPQEMRYVVAKTKIQNDFNMASTHMVLADANMESKSVQAMLKEIKKVDGVKLVAGLDSVLGTAIPEDIIPQDVLNVLKNEKYQLFVISSEYEVASDNVNNQIDAINTILKKYDEEGMLIGEAPLTKDLISITDHDFDVVNLFSIISIFVIIALVLKSTTLPIILVSVIEFAIFINLGLPYYTGLSLPFVAPISISTIQLGATVDYAILMTSRYKRERALGQQKHEAVRTALSTTINSIIVSGLGFFAATFGVGLYSDIDIISSMCNLMARGAIISMLSVIFILPSMFIVFDKIICATSMGFKPKVS